MALSIQIPYRGDQYLFQGISGAGKAIGDHIEEMADDLKKAKALRTMATDGLGMDPEKVNQMSLEQLQGSLQGAALKSHMAQMKQQQEEAALKMQQIREAQAQQSALQSFAQDYSNGPMDTNPNYRDLWNPNAALDRVTAAQNAAPEQKFLYALGRNPKAFSAPQFDNSLNALTRFEKAPNEIPLSELGKPTPIPGMPGQFFVPTSKGGGQVTQGPDQTARRVLDEKGTHVGYTLGGKFLSKDEVEGIPSNAEIEPLKDTTGKTVPGMYRDVKTGKIIKAGISPFDVLNTYMGGQAQPGGNGNKKDPLGLGIK